MAIPPAKRRGMLSKLFGWGKACCCNMKIEEAKEREPSGSSPESEARKGCCSEDGAERDEG